MAAICAHFRRGYAQKGGASFPIATLFEVGASLWRFRNSVGAELLAEESAGGQPKSVR